MSFRQALASTSPGIYALSADQLAALALSLRSGSDGMRQIHFPECRNITVALTHLGHALNFPDWYGNNLDALMDCLCDPDILAPSMKILLLTGLTNIHSPKGKLQALGEVLGEAAAERARNNMALYILCGEPLPGIPPLPLP